jgi:hypothetical protein
MESVAVLNKRALFEEKIQITGITEYGVSWKDLLAGKAAVPPEGANFDLAFEGSMDGPNLKGSISGIDYLYVRPDGRFELHIHACITTHDGERIAFYEDGVLTPSEDNPGIAALRLNMKFSTSSPKYTWLNKIQGWGVGQANTQNAEAVINAYRA